MNDTLILKTLVEDTTKSHEEALLKIYTRLRPGSPPQLDKARKLFDEKFRDDSRYRLGRVGRFRINRKFDQNVPEDVMSLQTIDFINSLKYIMGLRGNDPKAHLDDIDHLGNRRLRTIGELATEELRKGLLKLRRTVQERMTVKDPNELTRLAELVNSKSVSSSIEYFFGRGELSQVVDQTNPLSQLTHERRLSALGPGGLNRKRAGFEVRDVHISHYGRICPIETPEGTNIGLISSMGIYSRVDDYGFLLTPYRKVERGKVNGEVVPLRADEEMRSILAPPDAIDWPSRHSGHLPETEEKDAYLVRLHRETGPGKGGKYPLRDGAVLVRAYGEMSQVISKEIEYVDVSAKQTVGVSASLIPFLEHDDANRALMGSNMQRQAVPLLAAEAPVIATGMERVVAENSGMVIRSRKDGKVTYVDAVRIVIDDVDEYELRKFRGLNERTCLNQRPLVKPGDRVKKNQIIADGPSTRDGELALGKNILVAFMIYDGYNFEDAIVISEKLVHKDTFTSIHIEDYEVEVRETRLGREEFTRDIPNVSERALRNLDENGIVRIGTRVGAGRHPGRQGQPQEQDGADAGREAAPRDLRPGRRGRQERLAGDAGRGRRHRHRREAVQPAHADERGAEEGDQPEGQGIRGREQRQDGTGLQADGTGDRGVDRAGDDGPGDSPEGRQERGPGRHPRADREDQGADAGRPAQVGQAGGDARAGDGSGAAVLAADDGDRRGA